MKTNNYSSFRRKHKNHKLTLRSTQKHQYLKLFDQLHAEHKILHFQTMGELTDNKYDKVVAMHVYLRGART